MDQITKVMKIKKETNAMLEKLRALRKCHQNPTNKLAKDAIKNDPKAYDAVEKDLNARELEISLNGATRIVSTTVNNSAGVYLGKAVKVVGPVISKATSSLDKVEDTILKELAKETMKGAEKGIVPCDCDPVYTPLPPSEELASYPPASLSCEPKPEELVCQAAPPDSASKNFTPGPPPKLKSADVCVVLTHAQFTYTDSKQSSGCNAMGCGSREENTFYTGSATLKPVEGGYEGDGQGTYRHTGSSDDHLNIPRCNTENRIWWTEGAGGLKVNVQSSINNDVTGGIDTSGMSEDTSVAEIITNGDRLHDEEHTYTACEDPKDEAIDTQVIGFDCHFYGVDLHRPGFYQTYKDREPGSGICTLTLSQ